MRASDFTGSLQVLEKGRNARFFSPKLGRFAQPDAIIPAPFNPQSLNRYSYVLGNPISLTDPSGHCPQGTIMMDGEQCVTVSGNFSNTPVGVPDSGNSGSGIPDGSRNCTAQSGYMTSCDAPLLDGEWSAEEVAFFGPVLLDDHRDLRDVLGGGDISYITDGAIVGELLLGAVCDLCDLAATLSYWAEGDFHWADALVLLPLVPGTVGRIARGLCSFSADTLVETQEGKKPISEIEVGDYVLAFNEQTGETGYYPVTATWNHLDNEILYLLIDGEVIVTTPDHPFYTLQGEWVVAGGLEYGDWVVQTGGKTGLVVASTTVSQHVWMYNLTVAEAHTYYVGSSSWLVHNSCIIDPNKLHHIFGKPGRELGWLIDMFGSEEAAFLAVSEEFASVAKNYSPEALRDGIQVIINGRPITVRGTILPNGSVEIGTFFNP